MSTLSNAEINAIERTLNIKLPGLYRKLLVEVGCGLVGVDAEIYHPLNVRDLYEAFFDDPGQLFSPYFPFGCQKRQQVMWIIDAARELAATIWHETVPDDWPEEPWLEYDEWIRVFLEPEFQSG